MIQPINFDQDNIVGFTITGKVSAADIKQWASSLDQQRTDVGKLRVYIEVQELSDVTLDAILADLKFDVTHLTNFEKAAFVSNSALSNLSSMAAGLMPGLETKQFSLVEKEKAKRWLGH